MSPNIWEQIVRFSVVGGVGFVIDGTLLWLMIWLDMNPYLARALSFPAAVVVTWTLNRNWTFRTSRHSSNKGQLRRYFAVQMIGALSNYLVYSVFIGLFGLAGTTLFWGFALGSFVGAFINFCGARLIAFRAHET